LLNGTSGGDLGVDGLEVVDHDDLAQVGEFLLEDGWTHFQSGVGRFVFHDLHEQEGHSAAESEGADFGVGPMATGPPADKFRVFEEFEVVLDVGFLTAAVIRVELGDLRRFDQARQLSAFAGLNPSIRESGTSVRGRSCLGKKGNARARQALYLSARVAIRGTNDFRPMYYRLIARGKSPMTALGAIMRKMLCVMRAILIAGIPYNPAWQRCGKLGHANT
jgi:hypothetical protein